jgi:hypothetical protein
MEKSLKNSSNPKGPLKTHMIAKTIWFGCLALMAVVLTVSIFSDIGNDSVDGAKLPGKADCSICLPETPNIVFESEQGYRVHVDALNGYVTVSKHEGEDIGTYVAMEIRKITYETYEEYVAEMEKVGRQIKDGLNGWKYFDAEAWIEDPEKAGVANIKRTFFKELKEEYLKQEGILQAVQYDYTGGEYSQEIENMVYSIQS